MAIISVIEPERGNTIAITLSGYVAACIHALYAQVHRIADRWIAAVVRLDLFIQIALGVVLHLYAVVAAGGGKLLEHAVVLIVSGLLGVGAPDSSVRTHSRRERPELSYLLLLSLLHTSLIGSVNSPILYPSYDDNMLSFNGYILNLSVNGFLNFVRIF